MSNEVDERLAKLKDKLFSLPVTKEYLRLEELIAEDKILKGMRIEIAKLSSQGKNKKRDVLIEEYNSIPLVSNYNYTKDELFNILNEISKILK